MKKDLSDVTIPHFDIVICGGGPGGLLTGLSFWQRGARNILIVSPIMGDKEYTRAGCVGENVIEYINSLIDPLKFTVSLQRHIKDIERGLYNLIKEKTNIVLLKKKFVSLNKNQVNLVDEKTKEESAVTAKHLFDCTGVRRVVVNEINRLNPESPIFSINSLEEFKEQDIHFATFRTKLEDIKDVELLGEYRENPFFSIKQIDPLKYIAIIEELQKLGWEKLIAPYAYFIIGNGKDYNNIKIKSEKASFHMQISKPMEKENLIKYANLIAKILFPWQELSLAPLTFEKDKLKSDENKKKTTSCFDVLCRFVIPSAHKDDTNNLITFHLFDCSGNLPFDTGASLDYGIARMVAALDYFVIENGIIKEVALTQYDKTYNESIDISYKPLLAEYYIRLNSFYFNQMLPILGQYQKALEKCKDESEKVKLQKNITALQLESDAKLSVTHYARYFTAFYSENTMISEHTIKNKFLTHLLKKSDKLDSNIAELNKEFKMLIYVEKNYGTSHKKTNVPAFESTLKILKTLSSNFLTIFQAFRKVHLSDAKEIKKCNELLNQQIEAIPVAIKTILEAFSVKIVKELPSVKLENCISDLDDIEKTFKDIQATLEINNKELEKIGEGILKTTPS